jgi:hypothetical protein
MARILIVGCGCRGRALARALIEDGHAVRGTTRDEGALAEIEAAGAEPVLADPDRIATLFGALDGVTVACVLLGSATGSTDELAALHGTRLEMLLTKMVDTTVRGVLYEGAGSLDAALLEAGAGRVRDACVLSRIPFGVLRADPGSAGAWQRAAASMISLLLEGRSSP